VLHACAPPALAVVGRLLPANAAAMQRHATLLCKPCRHGCTTCSAHRRCRALQASLPRGMQLVRVSGGSAVLRCDGLYEVKLSLKQQPYHPLVQEAAAEAQATELAAVAKAAAAAEAAQEVTSAAAAGAGAEAAPADRSAAGSGAPASSPPSTDALPPWRWCWTLLDLTMLPGSAKQAPLRDVQLASLRQFVHETLWNAADAAALQHWQRRQAAAAAGEAAAPAAEAAAAPDAAAPAAGAPSSSQQPQPSASGLSGPSASGLSSGNAPSRLEAGRGVRLAAVAADEVARPLHTLHAALRDVGANLLIDACTAATKQLLAGARWGGGQLALARSQVVKPGLRLSYWLHSPAVTAAAATAVDVAPAVEVGVGGDGLIAVRHVPPLLGAAGQEAAALSLNPLTVDVEELLLQAAVVLAASQLRTLSPALQQALAARGLQQLAVLKLVGSGLQGDSSGGGGGGGAAPPSAWGGAGAAGSHAADGAGVDPAPAAVGAVLAVAARGILPASLLAPPTLEVWVAGTQQLRISFQLWSGKLQVGLGAADASPCSLQPTQRATAACTGACMDACLPARVARRPHSRAPVQDRRYRCITDADAASRICETGRQRAQPMHPTPYGAVSACSCCQGRPAVATQTTKL